MTPYRLSVVAYHSLIAAGIIPPNCEFLYGFICVKPQKSPIHAALILRLLQSIEAVLPTGLLLRPEQPITCIDSEPEPDISIVRGTTEEYWTEHPHTAELVIEICVTSHEYDRSKLKAYATAGVKECWLVLVPEKQIEIFRQPQDGRYLQRTLESSTATITTPLLPGFGLNLPKFFTR
jgi:Uma2 family endonuclease